MKEQKIYGYIRVSTKEQNEDRQRVTLLEMGVSEDPIYMDKQSRVSLRKPRRRKPNPYVRMNGKKRLFPRPRPVRYAGKRRGSQSRRILRSMAHR